MDNNSLTPSGKPYSGFYTKTTEILSFGKKQAGSLYDFNKTGLFLRSFHLSKQLSIFNTGEGTGLKKYFFDGYENMYGLTQENEDMILKEVKDFIGMQILNGLWE